MVTTQTVRRIVIIVDATLRDQIIDKLLELGATGYNCVACSGQGVHALTGDLFVQDELMRIETVVPEQTAQSIFDYIHATQFAQYGQYALSAYLDSVEVDIRDKSLSQ